MSYADDLLEQAEHLARRERKRPRQASLRRAISSAYYALFHLLISEAVRNWRRPDQRPALARMFEHGAMGRACVKRRDALRAVLKGRAGGGAVEQGLHDVAAVFAEMLQQRQVADYDGVRLWTRMEVLEQIEQVKGALRSWREIREEEAAQEFLVSLLLRDRKA